MIHRIRIYSHDAHVFTCCLQQFAVLFCFLLLCLRKSRSSSELRIVPLHLLHGVPSGALLWQRSHVLEMRSPACSQDLMGSMGAVEVTYKERSYLGKLIHPKIHWTKTCGCQISQKERAHTSLQANIVSRNAQGPCNTMTTQRHVHVRNVMRPNKIYWHLLLRPSFG